jgi:hypothetical protein
MVLISNILAGCVFEYHVSSTWEDELMKMLTEMIKEN